MKISKSYLNAHRTLYGSSSGVALVPSRSSSNGKRRQPEREEQIKFVVWLEKNNILFYAIPNGGSRNRLEAINLKRAGVRAGVLDLCIPVPCRTFPAMYVEMKTPGRYLTEAQKWWKNELEKVGNYVAVCYTAEEAIKAVSFYFGV